MIFRAGDKDWKCDLTTYALTEVKDRPAPPAAAPRGGGQRGGFRGAAGGRGDGGGGFRGRGGPARSPDGKWTASIKEHNVVLRDADGKETPLTKDGRDGVAYGTLEWSPDSQTLVAFRIEPGEREEVHLIETSPRAGGRAVLHSRNYALPGDKFTAYELRLFKAAEQKPIECKVDRIDFGSPRLRWALDGHTFTYQQVDRGHQRLRLIEVDARTGSSRNLIDEKSETFIWTAHTENVGLSPFTWLRKATRSFIAPSSDGWRHLYLVDAKTATIKNQITKGEYVVRGIERIDEDKRQIWFRASGRNSDQDPYFIHYYRVNFDGTGLVALTAGNGTHAVQYSPDEKYLIDTYSRIDQPPIHELRRVEDGQLVCKLEEADITELKGRGWEPPEVFTAKGRDGKTDIWGIICRPRNFDPGEEVPGHRADLCRAARLVRAQERSATQRRFSSLTDLGFVVVQMDGMGTANRSKAFHDVCWNNLKRRRPARPHPVAQGRRREISLVRHQPRRHLRRLGRRAEFDRRPAVSSRVLQGGRQRLRLPRQPDGQGLVERAVDGLSGRPAVRRDARTSITPPACAAS